MQLEAVAYTSSARRLPTETELEALLERARTVNAAAGVTGVLLHHDGCFVQYIEGAPADIASVYERILRAPLHRGLIELFRGPVARRLFDGWTMGFVHAPASTLLRLAHGHWQRQRGRLAADAALPDGAELLLHFCRLQEADGRAAA